MRFEPPLLTSPWRGRPGDLDGLLSEFFQSELPRQWTAPELPDEQPSLPLPAPKPARPSAWRSRFALAASVALLLGGFGLLGSKFKDTSAPRSTVNPSTGGEATHRPIKRETIEVDPSGQAKFRIELEGQLP